MPRARRVQSKLHPPIRHEREFSLRPNGTKSFLVICVALLTLTSTAFSQEAGGRESAGSNVSRPLELSALPTPSEALQTLLKKGRVTFVVGGPRPSLADPSRSTSSDPNAFDAETQFKLSYQFASRCRWFWRGQRLRVRVRYHDIELNVKHQVWLRDQPQLDQFWKSALVAHEMDHVRLSSDPRLLGTFQAAVKELQAFDLSLEEVQLELGKDAVPTSSKQLTGTQARQLVNAKVREQFDRIVELAEIRYQELDRQTSHGSRPLPESGKLRDWLGI